MTVIILYAFAVIAAALTFWGLLAMTKGQRATYYVLLFGTVFLVNLAQFSVGIAQNLGEAVAANRFTYFGGTFLAMFLILSMCEMCKIKVRNYVVIPMVLINSEMLAQVFLSDFSDIHFVSLELGRDDGYSYLIKEYGPHHDLYLVLLGCYVVAFIGIVIYAFLSRKKVSWKYTALLAMGGLISVGFYIYVRICDVNVELLPFGYIICELMFLIIIGRTRLYSVSITSRSGMNANPERGYVVIDSKIRLVCCDDYARQYFPEMNELEIDREIKQPYLCAEFGEWIKSSKEAVPDPKFYERDGRDIKVSVRPLFVKRTGRHLGYIMKVEDDTKNQEYIRNLRTLLNTDQLTGILNRHSFVEEFSLIDPEEDPVTIVAFDVNELKTVNDSLGHDAGDELIMAAAKCLTESFGNYGRCFRTGGDEFIAILYGSGGRLETIFAEFDEAVKKVKPRGTDGLTISYGYCDSETEPGLTPQQMLSLADKRMYDDKNRYYERTGKDRRRH